MQVDSSDDSSLDPRQFLGITRGVGIQQRQQADLLTLRPELLSHPEGHLAPKAITAQKIWAFWLEHLYFFEIDSRHLLNPAGAGLIVTQSYRLEPIKWLIRTETLSQILEYQDFATMCMDTKEWRLSTFRLNRHECGPRG